MATRQRRNTGLGKLVVPVFSILLSSYFLYHAQIGRFGWDSQSQLIVKAVTLENQLASLQSERKLLAKRVNLLRNGSIERDMLDEQARYHLNLMHVDEISIMKVNGS